MAISSKGDIGFLKAVNNFEQTIIDGVKRVIVETAEMAAAQMKALAPVDESNLRKSIEVDYSPDGLRAKIIVGAEYGIYLEYGTGIYALDGNGRKDPWVYYSEKLGRYVYTRGIHAQPYFHPAMEQASDFFTREMNKIG